MLQRGEWAGQGENAGVYARREGGTGHDRPRERESVGNAKAMLERG
jgi:hypothetical protein